MIVTGKLLHIPENVGAPFVVRLTTDENDMDLWFAYPTLEIAEAKLPELVSMWNTASDAIH